MRSLSCSLGCLTRNVCSILKNKEKQKARQQLLGGKGKRKDFESFHSQEMVNSVK